MLIDKPAGPTSHDVVARVRRVYGTRAVGHTGTLDPFATGLLVVLVGTATRLARFVEALPKTYWATVRLGVQTSTDDPTGEVIAVQEGKAASVSEARVRAALEEFVGRGMQRPPVFSAKKVAGERSYRRARRGEAVALAEVPVTVHRVELLSLAPPDLEFRATVSAGTYVRALARDLGERLETGAHLTALRRESIGGLRVEAAVPLDRLEPTTPLLSPLAVLAHLPVLPLDAEEARAVRQGRLVRRGEGPPGPVALTFEHELVAVGDREAGGIQPRVVLEGA
ncbi:MAG TPA: tRNA pseudouridine(55) synthase TruB [Gemmatimonadales bacterium]|nr:tRNA pseudouridine(55) synthase TruB [Gemmatimonadales bacterium]